MAFIIPAAVHLMTTDWDVDARARGAFAGSGEAQPATRNTKVNGGLPLTGASATGFVNTQASSATGPLRGVYWEYLATGNYDVSSNTKVMVFCFQFNAPNRVQMPTKANDGFVVRIGTDANSPPTNYKTWQCGGNDTKLGKAREAPQAIVIDLNDKTEDAEIGTFDNTVVETFGVGTVRFNISGSSTVQIFLQRVFVFDTTKNATNIPRFTGAGSTWDDIITAMGVGYTSKITHGWIGREGKVFSVACPIEIGDNSVLTNFDDEGASVFYPDTNDPLDPTVRVTPQAFRMHLNLRNNIADTARFSGLYNFGNSYPPINHEQSNDAVVTYENPVYNRAGRFDIGTSISGPATWNDCDVVWLTDSSIDVGGSTFKNPHGNHLLRLSA